MSCCIILGFRTKGRTPMRLMLVVIALVGVGSTVLAQESLREKVRKHGDIGTVILDHYHGAEMPDLVRDSDLIAQVMVQGENVRLSSDETQVFTDYSAQVLDRKS